MKVLCVHPGPLMFTKVFLRLEPLGLELVAQAARRAGNTVRIIDLQVETLTDYRKLIGEWQPDLVAFSCNYLANVPEIVDLAKATKAALPRVFICVGGHSASFVARALIEHGAGAIDCVLKGEGEPGIVQLIEAVEHDRRAISRVPGAVTEDGEGPAPGFVHSLDDLRPARDLLRHRRKYFIGILDPCASIEFSRGCPWDCAFCSAWTFYGRSYRLVSPEHVIEDIKSIREPGIFIVDDVAFIQDQHGFAIGEAIARAGIRKEYYLETRGDVLLRNKEVFQFWKTLGLKYMFLGIEAIDEDGLRRFRKRIPLGKNFEALEFARSLGIEVAINLIADPDWDEARFAAIREWCLDVPEVVNISINTPYPGTESWVTEQRRLATSDYRLFDIQHAVLPTKLPLEKFYRELLTTQKVLYRKHLNWRSAPGVAQAVLYLLMRGQTNFVRGIMKYNEVYDINALLADHARPIAYHMQMPPAHAGAPIAQAAKASQLYIHAPRGRAGRRIDSSTERFVEQTRMGNSQ
ncbi:MAG TPA: hopanoid C-3 methylase HpnR [Xanthobacteraceae bacterium]|jgi:hopanoid C-3 methylase HpnR|nr:hopanoid C-3 methylase HpnR [Xanthobacteraceae bacterium]